jgi:hypothetical protein
MLWHAFLFLGLWSVGFFPTCSFLIGGFHRFFLLNCFTYVQFRNKYCNMSPSINMNNTITLFQNVRDRSQLILKRW